MRHRVSPLVPFLLLAFVPATAAEEPVERPLLVTVDDLPIAGGGHDDPEERLRITEGLLGHLERDDIQAVGLVTWRNVRDEGDRALLERWLAAGHGYEITGADVLDAFSYTMQAAEQVGQGEETLQQVRGLVASDASEAGFVARILGPRLGTP